MKSQLQTYARKYPSEANLTKDFLDFLDASEGNQFDRCNRARHFTASAWLLSPQADEVLLTHHKKLNAWLQLGGHCDGSADVLAAAIREAEEESGISGIEVLSKEILDIDKHLIPSRKDEPEHFHYDIRYLLKAPTRAFVMSDESNNLKWFNLKDEFFSSPEAKSLRKLQEKSLRILGDSSP